MKSKKNTLAVLIVSAFVISTTNASAATTNLPWEGPLTTLKNSLSGPVALAISVIALIAAGAGLVWGGEMSDTIRKLVIIVLVISILVAANSMVSTLWGVSAALL